MTDLNDLFKVIAEGKKEYEETDPVGKKLKAVKENVKVDLSSLFSQLTSLKEDLEKELVVAEAKQEQAPMITEEIPYQPVIHTPEVRAKQVSKDLDKYLTDKSFQQPQPEVVDKDVEAIRNKIKFLEQAIGKIAAAGPGSGEVNFRWLDDVNRATMTPSNDNWVLEYDSATKKVQFTENVGPIQTLRFNTTHTHDEIRHDGTVCWNSVDKTLNLIQNEVTQHIGQETHGLIRNRTGATITKGSFVRFSGAEQNGVARLLVTPFLGDGTYPNLFGFGVSAEDILDDADGFVTVFGKVRDLNTTSTGITSETWQPGDILYASPTTAGKLTKVKPTAPNNVIPVAAVLRVDDEIGELFVRPTYEQKRTYGTFADKTNQYAAEAATVNPNAVYPVTFNTTEVANGHRRGTDTSQIISEASGLFNYQFSMQFVSTNSAAKEVYIWFRKNGNDIPDSASRITITGNDVYSVAAWDITVSMNVNDYFQIMWAVTNTSVHISAPAATAFCPAIPSVLLTVSEVAL